MSRPAGSRTMRPAGANTLCRQNQASQRAKQEGAMSGIVRFFASSLPLWEASDGAAPTADGGAVGGASGDQTAAAAAAPAQEQAQQVENDDGDGPSSRAGSGPANISGAGDTRTAEAGGANATDPSSTSANSENAGASKDDNRGADGQAAPSSTPGPTMSVEQYGQSLVPTANADVENSGTADDAADTGAATGDNVTMEVEQPTAPAATPNAPSLTYEEWSALRRKAFERYMNRRMVSPSFSSSSSSSQSSSSSTSDGNNKRKKSKGAKGDGSPSQDTAESSLLLSASSGSPASSTGLLSSIDGSPMKQQSLGSPDGRKKADDEAEGKGGDDDDDDDESRNSIDGSPLPEYAAAEADGDEVMDESMFDDADIPETDIFQVFEDDADYHHGRDHPLETQPETQEQMLPETQEDPPLPVQQSQSQSPEAMSQSQSQSQTMDTQPLLESQPETQEEVGVMMLGQDSQQDEDDDDDEEEDVDDLPDTQDATQKSPDVVPMDVEVAANVVPESSAKKRKKSDKKKSGKKKKEEDANRRRRKDRRKILHESQTRGTANTVEQINLRVHTVNLGLCRVVTAWPLRKTKRLHWQADTNSAPTDSANGHEEEHGTATPAKGMGGLRILTSPYKDFEDDGPLGNIYRSVLTLEVEEVVDEEREEALREQRRLFQRPFELTDDADEEEEAGDKNKDSADKTAVLTAKTKRRIRVFLYGKYANKVSRLLSEWKYRLTPNSKTCALAGEGREEVLLSLNNVPARCVFPYYGRTSSEAPILDNELGRCSRYCLCIGSNSHMMVTSDDAAEGEKERFDTVNSVGSAADLEMRIVMVRKEAMAAVVGSPSQVEIELQHSASSSTFKSTAESILSLSAIERKESEGPGPNASDLAARYSEIIVKKEKRLQQLIEEARGEGTSSNKDQDENVDAAQGQGAGGNENGDQVEAPGANTEEGTAGEEGEQARKRRRTSARYHTLAELQPFLDALKSRKQDMQSGKRAYHRFDDSTNVYAIALSSSAPYRTKRGDWMVSVLLIDESLPPTKLVNDSNENNSNADNIPANPSAHIYVPSISINIFHPDKSKLPVIRYAGDVIRAHRVAVQEYNGDIQLVGRRNSSFYVVRPRNEKLMMENPQGQGWVESYTASKPSMLDVDDYLRMRDLWRWGRQRFGEHPILHGKERISIADVGPVDDLERAMAGIPIERTVTNGDLIAMVTAIIPQPPEQVSDRTPRAFLRLWDGTGRPESDPILVDSLAARQAIQEGDPSSSVLTAISKIVPTLTKGVGGDGESEGFEPPKCLCGRVVNVAIWEAEQWERIRSNESGIRVGKFVRLKNVNDGRLGAENPKRCLMAHQRTSIVPVPDQSFEVRSLLRAHNARILRKDPPNPSSGILPLSVPAVNEAEAARDAEATDASVPAAETNRQGPSPAEAAEPQVAWPSYQAAATGTEEFFTLAEVIGGPDETEPATFKSRFTVYGTIPEVDVESGDGFKDLCVPADPDDEASEELAYEFSLSIRDNSAEINVIVLNDVAETFFMSVTASDVCKKGGTRGGRRRPKEFNQGLKDLKAVLAEDAVWEGDICTAILEDEKYFVLKSLTRVNDETGA